MLLRAAAMAMTVVLWVTPALSEEWRVVGWGDDDAGQISIPDEIRAPVSVTTSDTHTCVLDASGAVRCFGCLDASRAYGQCDASKIPPGWHMDYGGRRTTEKPLIAVAAAPGDSCGITVDGEVECWGCKPNRQISQCKLPVVPLRARLPSPGRDTLATGEHHTCVIGEDGRLTCFGCDDKAKPECVGPNGAEAVSVALSFHASCALAPDGRVSCWGADATDPPAGLRAVRLAAANFADVACAIDAGGSLACWGKRAGPILCSPTRADNCVPAAAPSGRWVDVAVGGRGTCALSSEGEVACGGCKEAGTGVCTKPSWVRGARSLAVSGSHAVAVVPASAVPSGWRPPAATASAMADLVAKRRRLPPSRAWLEERGDFTNWLGMRFKTIRPGSFVMGGCPPGKPCPAGAADRDAYDNEWPPHPVTLARPFQLGLFEVTIGDFRKFLAATGYAMDKEFDGINAMPDHYPVTWVAWKDARAYVEWLNRSKPADDRGTYRLASEAEWEYAARGGTSTRYWFGDEASGSPEMNCEGCDPSNPDGPLPVGSYPPNPFGLYDMLGNSDEFVADCLHDTYEGAPGDGSEWGEPGCRGTYRVSRGGSWEYPPASVRASWRDYYAPDTLTWENGFRVARQLP
jgi:formylglycine-generating enzyme required for sulfatase activity